jgi:hypothetical protein
MAQKKYPVLVAKTQRQPILPAKGTGLSRAVVPTTAGKVTVVTNPHQRLQ